MQTDRRSAEQIRVAVQNAIGECDRYLNRDPLHLGVVQTEHYLRLALNEIEYVASEPVELATYRST